MKQRWTRLLTYVYIQFLCLLLTGMNNSKRKLWKIAYISPSCICIHTYNAVQYFSRHFLMLVQTSKTVCWNIKYIKWSLCRELHSTKSVCCTICTNAGTAWLIVQQIHSQLVVTSCRLCRGSTLAWQKLLLWVLKCKRAIVHSVLTFFFQKCMQYMCENDYELKPE